MSQRSTVTGAAWAQIGTGPATVELISSGPSVMVLCQTATPTGVDGLLLVNQGDNHNFQLSQAIWALAVNSAASAVVAVQPE